MTKSSLIPVEGHPNFCRDKNTGAIVNTDSSSFAAYHQRNSQKKKNITICVDPVQYEIFKTRRSNNLQSVSSIINTLITASNKSIIDESKILNVINS